MRVSIKLSGSSRQEVVLKSIKYAEQYPTAKFGTFFHCPRFEGYVDGRECWEITGERNNV